MCRLASKDDLLGNKSVTVLGSELISAADMIHKSDVDIIKNTLPDQLRFAAQHPEPAGIHQLPAEIRFNRLLGRGCDKYHLSA